MSLNNEKYHNKREVEDVMFVIMSVEPGITTIVDILVSIVIIVGN